MDTSRVEFTIRSLPGVVACQFTPTSVLVLVGPDGDAGAINAQVAAMLAEVAAERSVHVLAAPKPAAVVPMRGWRGRRRAAAAVAGTVAALTASVAAAATVAIVRVEPQRRSTDAHDELAGDVLRDDVAPETLPPVADQVPRRRQAPSAPPAPSSDPAPAPAPSAEPARAVAVVTRERHVATSALRPPGPAEQPVIIEVPLPPALVEPGVAAASAVPPAADDTPPFGVARRVRNGGHGPAAAASPVATAEGSKDHRS